MGARGSAIGDANPPKRSLNVAGRPGFAARGTNGTAGAPPSNLAWLSPAVGTRTSRRTGAPLLSDSCGEPSGGPTNDRVS